VVRWEIVYAKQALKDAKKLKAAGLGVHGAKSKETLNKSHFSDR
jgi:hypothetical protein